MFFALRHDAVVSGNSEQHQIDSMSARQHVADESLMAWYIDDPGASAIGQGEVAEPQVNRNSPFLLLLESIGLLASKRTDQGSLAVVNMARRTDNRMNDLSRHTMRKLRLELRSPGESNN